MESDSNGRTATIAAPRNPYEGIGDAPLIVGEPCLQAPAETTMGVSWAISGLAKGEVEYADNPELRDSKIARPGGFGLVPIDYCALQVRLEGLKPATRYWYRAITTPFADYKNIYEAILGAPVVGKVHSFTTLGEDAVPHFVVTNDTHGSWGCYQRLAKKIRELRPSLAILNGDMTNTTQDKHTAVEAFLDPPIAAKDWSADIPAAFENGNHDCRGSWISRMNEVMLPRHPAERLGSEWDLKWNFAVRLGPLALIGMDTGEDKPDAHPKWFGLANYEPYRKAQCAWLERALARPDIASAEMRILICHIPLFAAPDHPDFPHDGAKIDPHDYAHWSKECHDLWAPILEKHGVKAVIAGHTHKCRHDLPAEGRPWHQIVGGGECLETEQDLSLFPSVLEFRYESGSLNVTVHDVLRDRIPASFSIPRD